jgi:acetyl-CoA carboxylase beta subunit
METVSKKIMNLAITQAIYNDIIYHRRLQELKAQEKNKQRSKQTVTLNNEIEAIKIRQEIEKEQKAIKKQEYLNRIEDKERYADLLKRGS